MNKDTKDLDTLLKEGVEEYNIEKEDLIGLSLDAIKYERVKKILDFLKIVLDIFVMILVVFALKSEQMRIICLILIAFSFLTVIIMNMMLEIKRIGMLTALHFYQIKNINKSKQK